VRFDVIPDTPLSIDLPYSEGPPEGADHLLLPEVAGQGSFVTDSRRKENLVHSFSARSVSWGTRAANVPDCGLPPASNHARGPEPVCVNLEWPHPDALTYNFRGRHQYIEYTLPDRRLRTHAALSTTGSWPCREITLWC
jgi:hypothetical protein